MMQALPKVLPVNELKNTANILKVCEESKGPIIITRNGYGEAVMMSLKVYEEMIVQMRAAALIDESIEEIENGVEMIPGDEFFKQLKTKYGK